MSRTTLWGDLPMRLQACFNCQKGFKPEDIYFSELKGDSLRGYDRSDYCQVCWEFLPKDNKTRSCWHAQVPARDKKRVDSPKVWSEKAVDWLKQQLQNPDSDCSSLYVLAMILTREKSIVFRQEIQGLGEERLLLYEVLATEELLAIPKIEVAKLSLAAIQERLEPLFKQDHNYFKAEV